MSDAVAVEGRSCWRRVSTGRLAFLVDGAAYYEALASAFEQATRSILIVGWDVNSRVALRRSQPADAGVELANFLAEQVRRRRSLRVHILLWDFAMIYALEREILPVLRLGWRTPRRIHLALDDRHPLGASRHQKIVVVDDALAFTGGLDLTGSRWDTPEHRPEDPRRLDPWGRAYGPFHDLQAAVDGDAARALGELVRRRWRRVTGHALPEAPVDVGERWPDGVESDVRDTWVALARTEPEWEAQEEVREVERLHLDSIAAARSLVYIENQYFSSASVGDALEARLREPDGPEVVLVGPRDCSGWLEEASMGRLRACLIQRLRDADARGRFHAYQPMASLERDVAVTVHAKLMLVDDALARVGSANLSNRSMGLDGECDLAVEAEGRADVARAIAGLRHRLLAEHLGTDAARVARAEREQGSLAAAIEQLRGGDRTLAPLEASAVAVPLESAARLADPEKPVSPGELWQQLLPEDPARIARHPALRVALLLVPLLALAAAWRFTELGERADPASLLAAAAPLRDAPWAPLAGFGAFVAAASAMLPVTALIVAAGLIFGAWQGALLSLLASLASALLAYLAGRLLWRDAVRKLGGRQLNRLSRAFARRGVLAVALLRLVPVAPFTVVNLVAGSTHVRPREFLLGTLLGMTPGILALTVFAGRALAAARDPGPGSLAALAAVVALALLGLRWIRKRVSASLEEAPSA